MKRKQMLLKSLFFGSICLNLFFIGLFSTDLIERYAMKQLPPERLYAAVSVLDSKQQKEAKTILDQHTPHVYTNMALMLHQFEELRKTMVAPTLQTEKIETHVNNMNSAHAKVTNSFFNIMTDMSAVLDDKARVNFFETALPDFPSFIDKKTAAAIKNGESKK